MAQMIKDLVKKVLHLFRLEVHKIPTSEQIKRLTKAEMKQLWWLRDLQIKTVLDIGANTGQFAQGICELLPGAMIYSFEPLPDCYEELVTDFADIPQFKGFNLALGNETGKIKINHNEFSPSSSLLPMAELHKETFTFAQKEVVQEVSIARLDDVAGSLELREPILIKVDVQGFEDRVIDGGIGVFKQASVIIIELSIEQLYEGQLLFDAIYQTLKDLGFQYRGNYAQAHNADGRILYVDGIFTK
jgi:FkbM family methyltransferase